VDFLIRHIEALIFCAPEPIAVSEISKCMSEMFAAEVPLDHIESALSELGNKYNQEEYSFALEHLGGGYQFLTKPAYQPSISILLRQQSQKRLSTAQLETLSIIA
jgi:segregation and condensation protein B